MGFIEETCALLGFDSTINDKTFCYITPSSGIIVEGYKKIYELSSEKVTLLCEEGKSLTIIGKELTIKQISHKEITILGTISNISFD